MKMYNNKSIVIISCGKKKVWDKDPNTQAILAKDAYISNYFKLCKRYAERFSDKWFILSAKYGFINPDFVIPNNYDVKLKNSKDQTAFIGKLKKQAEELGIKNYNQIIVLTGKEYYHVIKVALEDFGLEINNPLEGLGIGNRQKIIKNALTINKHIER